MPCPVMSRHSSGEEPLLHDRCCNLFPPEASREFLIHAQCLDVRRQGNTSCTLRNTICLQLEGSFSYMPRDGICLIVRRLGIFSYTPCSINCSRSSVGESLLHAPSCNLSRRCLGGEFLLHAPCWNLSCRSSVGESLLHAPCCNLSRR